MPSNLSNGHQEGILIVLSGPSGVGKGTVCNALRQRLPELVYSVSATTRAPRQGEEDGVNYFFRSKQQFQSMIEQDELLEWAEYVGQYYGTPRQFVEDSIRAGRDVILEIDVQGALQVKKKFSRGVLVFLLPPTLVELQNRITMRGTESRQSIRERMSAALAEIRMLEQYDYAIVNDQVERACTRIESIIVAEHCRRERIVPLIQTWMEEVH